MADIDEDDLMEALQAQVSQLIDNLNEKDAEVKKIVDAKDAEIKKVLAAHEDTKKQLETLRASILQKNATLNKLADENRRFKNQLGIR